MSCWLLLGFFNQHLKSEFLILAFCSSYLLELSILKLLQLPMLVNIFLYKYVSKTDHTGILLPYFLLFNPILSHQDFVKGDCVLFTTIMVLWYLLVKVYFTSDFFPSFLMLLHVMG